jgi:hypothetical protein
MRVISPPAEGFKSHPLHHLFFDYSPRLFLARLKFKESLIDKHGN